MSKCTTWKLCVKNQIKTFKKKHPGKKMNLKDLLKKAKAEYSKEKKGGSKPKTRKRHSTHKRRTRKHKK